MTAPVLCSSHCPVPLLPCRAREETERTFPWIFSHPRVAATVAAATAGALLYTTMQARARWSLARAARLQQ